MGEAADKMNHNGSHHNGSHHNGSHKRVEELRNEIARKRDLLSVELDELRRRREAAVLRSKQTAKMAAGGMVGLFVISSLTNAVFDLFRKDRPETDGYDGDRMLMTDEETKTVAKKEATTSALVSAVATLLINEIRKMAIEYAKKELSRRLLESRYVTDRTHRTADTTGPRQDVA